MKLGLHWRLLVSLLGLFILSSVLLGVVFLSDAENRLSTVRETQARYQAKTLAEGSLDALVTEDFELLERWTSSAMPSKEYAYAALVRPSGKALTHTDLTLIGEQVSTVRGIRNGVIRQTQYRQRPVMEAIHPAVIGDQVLANAHVAYYLDVYPGMRRDTINHIVGILALSFILLFGASYFITRSITVPLRRLKKIVHQASLDEVVSIEQSLQDRSDEVGELARAFYGVSDSLVKSHNELTGSLLANKAIVDSSIDGIIVINDKGIIESINSAGERIFGYSAAEIEGKNVNILMSEPYRNGNDHGLQVYDAIRASKIIGKRREVTGLRKDGSKIPLELAVGEIVHDHSIKYAGTVRDITLRYEYEQALLLAKDAAEEGNRAKTEFLSTISHELRTPMNGILGSIDLMQSQQLTPELQEFVAMAQRSARHLMVLLNNILDFSDLDAGRLELEETEIDIEEMARSVVETYAMVSREKTVAMSYEVDVATPHTLVSDASRLRNVISHFMSNAVKFTKQGQIVLKICCINEFGGKVEIRVEVSDTGIGIEYNDQSRIFDLFTQVDGSYTRRYQGTGIGLTLCKRIVEAMGGEIGVVSEPGIGSTFWFTMLVGIDASLTIQAEREDLAAESESRSVRHVAMTNKRVLVVEDDVLNQQIIAVMLKRMGYTYNVVGNGQEALNVFQQDHYDLVLMDCQMPVMNGFEATERIRKFEAGRKHTPIIAVTANAMKGDREKCLSAGMDDYVTKPVSRQTLETTINSWMSA